MEKERKPPGAPASLTDECDPGVLSESRSRPTAGLYFSSVDGDPKLESHGIRYWRLPGTQTLLSRIPGLAVAISMFVVVILLVPTSNVGAPTRPATNSVILPSSQAGPGAPPFYPYITSNALYPSPDQLPNVSGSISLPQLSNLTIGNSFVYVLVFVNHVPLEGTILEFDTGTYSPAAALAIGSHNGCTNNCTQHLPIEWNPPSPIAAYGGTPIQGDALAIEGSGPNASIFVAASSNNSTTLYVSDDSGAPNTWFALTGEQPILGGDPRIALSPGSCQLAVTTRNAVHTFVTTFRNTCLAVPPTSGNGGETQQDHRPVGTPSTSGQLPPPPTGGTAFVYGVVPLQSNAGNSVEVYGSGFSAAQSVRFGSTSVAFTVQSSTKLSATVPGGSGITNVQVMAASVWSTANCSNQFQWGSPLPTGTPQISWITHNASKIGSQVTLYGFNFVTGDLVYFGGTAATGVSVVNSNNLLATVPTGSGTVNVSVQKSGLVSPVTCADLFHYQGPFLNSISPTSGFPPQTVTLNGVNFSSTAKVYFGPNASASVTHVSSTQLKATLPLGLGAVAVTVQQSGFTSNSLTFTYTPPTPSVLGIVPNQGPAGAGVAVYGGNLNASSYVYFGTQVSTSVQDVSTGLLIAKAPAGSGQVNVTVRQFGKTSAIGCTQRYSYGTALPTGVPALLSISSPNGVSGANITVRGVNLSTSDLVEFGGVPSPKLNTALSNSTVLVAMVPIGVGNVSITVVGQSGNSALTCADHFWIPSPGRSPWVLPRVTATLKPSEGAFPAFLPSVPLGLPSLWVLATIGTEFVSYSVTGGSLGSTENVTAIGNSLGSSILSQVGSSERSIPGGSVGQISATPDSNGLFVMVTADQDGRTVLESLVWPGEGASWSTPYFSLPVAGSASDPQVAGAPYGDIYAAWLENGAGPNQIDTAIFSATGAVIMTPSVLPGSGGSGTTNNSAAGLSLSTDPSGRPMVMWAWGAGKGMGSLLYTGQYESPQLTDTLIQTAWNLMIPVDFEALGGPGLLAFEARVTGGLTNVLNDLTPTKWCGAEQNASNLVYTNITWIDPAPVQWGPTLGCNVYVGTHHNTLLANEDGILDSDFYLSVETEWLMESLGVGVTPIPNWASPMFTPAPGKNLPFWPDQGAAGSDAHGDVAQVAPDTVSTNALWLRTTANFLQNVSSFPLYSSGGSYCGQTRYQDSPTSYQIVAKIVDNNGPTTGTFTSATWVPSPFFTYLYTDENGTWTATITAVYQTVETVQNNCNPPVGTNTTQIVTTPVGWPTTESISLAGNFTTGLDPHPTLFTLVSNPNNPSTTANDKVGWANTVNASAALWLNGTCGITCDAEWGNSSAAQYDHASGGAIAFAPNPFNTMNIVIQSTNKPVNTTYWPIVNTSEVSVSSPVQTFNEGCTVPANQTAPIWATINGNITGLTSNNGTFTWYSTVNASGWVTLQQVGGEAYNVSAQVLTLPNRTAYEYTVDVKGLASWDVYSATYYVLKVTPCKTSTGATMADVDSYDPHPVGNFQVPGQPQMFEQDAPYDSVSLRGGGATVAWQVPISFEATVGTQFVNGSLTVSSTNSSIATTVESLTAPQIPFTNYSLFGSNGSVGISSATTFAINLTDLYPNNPYTAILVLNYSTVVNPHFVASNSMSFTYEKDTSGDGLSDWEKAFGWAVTTTNVAGATSTTHVTANATSFATNGLVGDFVEKQYGLNPRTVDSAGSHMLDTWNLTFDLSGGGGNGYPPSWANFEYWNESWGSNPYNPFSTSVNYSYHEKESGSPLLVDQGNVTPSHGAGIRSGDGSPWAAEVLWSYSALKTFEGLPGVKSAGWLRAVLGEWNGHPTLTVWGKLSWGANPLAASTPGNGLVDGSRVNPLFVEALQVSKVFANTSGLGTGTGWAVKMIVRNGSATSGASELSNYSSSAIVGGSTTWINNYAEAVPVSQTYQNQTLDLEIVANESGPGLTPLAVNGAATDIDLTYDMVMAQPLAPSEYFGSGGVSNLAVKVQALPFGAKVPTWLWIPTANSTVTPLPVGLQRYVGEQSFALIILNVTASVSSDSIPLPWGGYASVPGISLTPGLNQILVPREQFLYSPIGQALLLGRGTGVAGATYVPDLTGGTPQQDLLSAFGSTDWMTDLGAYWQNRSIASGPGNITGSSEKGTVAGTTPALDLLATKTPPGNNSGGLPSTPALYNSSTLPAAVQTILTLNITNTSTLDLLIAGLMDNATGGINGTLASVTYQVGFLGLGAAVVDALANQSLLSDGLYRAPSSSFPPPPPSGFWGTFWNAVTAVVQTAAHLIVSLVTVVWNAVLAAVTYVDHMYHEALSLGAQLVQRAAAAMVSLGKALLSALEALAAYIIKIVQAAIGQALGGFRTLELNLESAWNASLSAAASSYHTGRNISQAEANGLWALIGGTVFLIGFALATVAVVVLAILAVVSLGADEVVDLILGLILTVAVALALPALGSLLTASMVNNLAAWAGTEGALGGYAPTGTGRSAQTAVGASCNLHTDFNPCPSSTDAVGALASSYGWFCTGFTNSVAAVQLYQAFFKPLSQVSAVDFDLQAIAFGVGLVGAELAALQLATGCTAMLAFAGLLLSASSVVFDLYSLTKDAKSNAAEDQENVPLDAVILGMDASTTEITIAQMAA
jgi:hypothetical protein